VLFNPKKRELYAWAGEQGIKEGGGGAVMNLKDIINMFFDGGGAAAARLERCLSTNSPAMAAAPSDPIQALLVTKIQEYATNKAAAGGSMVDGQPRHRGRARQGGEAVRRRRGRGHDRLPRAGLRRARPRPHQPGHRRRQFSLYRPTRDNSTRTCR